jgi:hypothetical protein
MSGIRIQQSKGFLYAFGEVPLDVVIARAQEDDPVWRRAFEVVPSWDLEPFRGKYDRWPDFGFCYVPNDEAIDCRGHA